jgi:hypothetical protein
MKKFINILLTLLIFNILAYARLSFGISLGDPTGLSLKIQQQKTSVYDLCINFSTKDSYLYFHTDFLKYDYEKIVSKELSGQFPVFYGLGIKIESIGETTVFGIRLVGGLEYIFSDIPFEIFFKIAPVIELVPSTSVRIAPSVGIRYIFK